MICIIKREHARRIEVCLDTDRAEHIADFLRRLTSLDKDSSPHRGNAVGRHIVSSGEFRKSFTTFHSEPFSSCVCLADLQYVDGLGELAG
jgi:hypothetical protein